MLTPIQPPPPLFTESRSDRWLDWAIFFGLAAVLAFSIFMGGDQ